MRLPHAALESVPALRRLRAEWDRHDRVLPGPHHLLGRVRDDEPRLAGRIARLCAERDALAVRLHHLFRSADSRGDDCVTAEITAVRAAIRAHERRVNDLLHEAYDVDLGTAG